MSDEIIKIQSNKQLKPYQVKVLGGVLLAFFVFLIPVSTFWMGINNVSSQKRLESVAYQVFEIRRQVSKRDRGPASADQLTGEGSLGKSPSGKPYEYRVRKEATHWVVQVWESGDSKNSTEVRIQSE